MSQADCEIVNEQVAQNGFPELLTEDELVEFLRIPLVSRTGNHHNVVEHLKRARGLPCLHISKQPLYWLPAIRDWIQQQVEQNR